MALIMATVVHNKQKGLFLTLTSANIYFWRAYYTFEWREEAVFYKDFLVLFEIPGRYYFMEDGKKY